MLKSELLEKLKDVKDDADINETILSMDDFAKSSEIDVTKITLDDYKNILASNEAIKGYYQSTLDSSISKAVDNHDKKFMKEKFPKLLEEEIKKRDTSNLTPEQQQLRELQEQLAAMKAEKEQAELLNANIGKLKNNGLDTSLAKYIQGDDDITFFKELISNSVQAGIKEKLGNSNYKPPANVGEVNAITKEQFNKMIIEILKENSTSINVNPELFFLIHCRYIYFVLFY